jgi:hypothetical protein
MFLGFEGTKGLILKILLDKKELSAKKIFLFVKRRANKQLSYQSVHKLLILLVEKKVLVKNNNNYLINKFWVFDSMSILNNFDNSSENSNEGLFLNKFLIFKSIYDCDKFLVSIKKIFNPVKDDEFGLVWIHFWIPLFLSNEVYLSMRKFLTGSKFYCITPSSSKIDKWCSEFWKKFGVLEKVGIGDFGEISMLIYKDFIVQVFYPSEIRKALDKVYNSTNNPSKLDLDKFFKTVFEKKTRIPVLISRNQGVADEIMTQIKSNFK